MAGGKIAAKVGRAACPHAAEGWVLATKNTETTKAMKPSGVAWLGDIPEGWEMRRLKTCFSIVSGSGFKEHLQGRTDGDYPVFKARDIGKADVTLNYSKNWITSDEVETEGFKIIPANSILMPKIGEAMRKNSRAISGVACCVDNNCQGLLPRMVDVKLSYYLLCSIDVRAFDNGGAIPCINNQAFLDFSCPLPPLPEQRTIADYLDEKCGAIDAAVTEAKKGIEEYKAWKKSLIFEAVTGKRRVGAFNAKTQSRREAEKMKHSGIPWIGEIPEGWKLARLKNCAKVFGRIGFRGYTTADIVNEGEGALSLSPSNLKDIRMDYAKRTYISWSKYEESPEIKVCKGDIVFVKTGSSYGKACIVDDMPCEATLNPQLVVLKCFSCHNRYLNYYLQTPLIKYQVELIVSGGTIPTMSQEKMGCWKIILPPLSEQQAIADYLDEKCAAIDAMVAEKEALIADLEAYKKSLIFELVTGKREVA